MKRVQCRDAAARRVRGIAQRPVVERRAFATANACRVSPIVHQRMGERTNRVNGSRIGQGLKGLERDADWTSGNARGGNRSPRLSPWGARSLVRSGEW